MTSQDHSPPPPRGWGEEWPQSAEDSFLHPGLLPICSRDPVARPGVPPASPLPTPSGRRGGFSQIYSGSQNDVRHSSGTYPRPLQCHIPASLLGDFSGTPSPLLCGDWLLPHSPAVALFHSWPSYKKKGRGGKLGARFPRAALGDTVVYRRGLAVCTRVSSLSGSVRRSSKAGVFMSARARVPCLTLTERDLVGV